MNFIKHFIEWMNFVAMDERLTPHHVSLYLALFQSWNLSHFRNPVSISRQQIMQVSRIGSVNTYSKCIKELDAWGYIRYEPSYNPLRGSKVHLFRFDNADDKGSDKADGQLPIKALRPSLNYLNNTNTNKQKNSLSKQPVSNLINVDLTLKADQVKDSFQKEKLRPETEIKANAGKKIAPKEKGEDHGRVSDLCRKKDTEIPLTRVSPSYTWMVPVRKKEDPKDDNRLDCEKKFRPPEESEVISFFQNVSPYQGGSEAEGTMEARKFFNYFQSVGWKVGKSKPMKDWQAAARNWILNAGSFSKLVGQQNYLAEKKRNPRLHANKDKNYGEPL